ncbi:hypothetical protein JQ557_08625 [Bradyrhizobium sp. U87765 SZCCT0131]|uniref:hypothetical protein n=1 Tax=unclassified Bradyrhizobium TaxID=2631580 RepID=UPI001BA459CA|nr:MULTISPECIES: hypothetical protein [unclassified Bradyrhizobium]MBR1218050.1 hypothetical protein [Bradyrhizobium sp. U87765 SZCCT0131]MBR1261004.1 hypothetical protein [Bradyrhizobium sp. U87765 SZCCT0134]MBR1303548.1 hypothetical protein [Bradyrhizobium sp. U87765 SZCCT0110]MBR1319154.1 hypothetical protein [Bradyrhizobium sp. U87765 SZCCT0109]MBR1347479.1 hypothetical protein [Bradyrhizobium sp. U87765 SZCCT0048]
MPSLFDPIQLGTISAPNRILMAPLTRARNTRDHVGDRRGVNDSHPETLFEAVARSLSGLGIAFLDVREPGYDGTFGRADRPPIAPLICKAFGGPLVLNTDYDQAKA